MLASHGSHPIPCPSPLRPLELPLRLLRCTLRLTLHLLSSPLRLARHLVNCALGLPAHLSGGTLGLPSKIRRLAGGSVLHLVGLAADIAGGDVFGCFLDFAGDVCYFTIFSPAQIDTTSRRGGVLRKGEEGE